MDELWYPLLFIVLFKVLQGSVESFSVKFCGFALSLLFLILMDVNSYS